MAEPQFAPRHVAPTYARQTISTVGDRLRAYLDQLAATPATPGNAQRHADALYRRGMHLLQADFGARAEEAFVRSIAGYYDVIRRLDRLALLADQQADREAALSLRGECSRLRALIPGRIQVAADLLAWNRRDGEALRSLVSTALSDSPDVRRAPTDASRDLLRPDRGSRMELDTRPATAPAPALSPRELQVLDGIVRGQTSNAIAASLGVKPTTVATLVGRIFDKLGVNNRPAAVAAAIRSGICDMTADPPPPIERIDAVVG